MKEPRERTGPRPIVPALVALVALGAALTACDASPSPVGEDAGPPRYGAPCGEGMPCGAGLVCLADFPGGYCTAVCDVTPCGEGAVCDRGIAPSLCTDRCASRAECRDGYQCWRGGCLPACTADGACGAEGARCVDGQCVGAECETDAMCPPGWGCDGGACVERPDAGPVLGGDGQPCTADGDCASGICLPPERGGICTRACVDALSCAGAGLPFSAACGPVTRRDAVGTYCIPFGGRGAQMGDPCTTNADCMASTCVGGFCTEACDEPPDCALGMECGDTPYEAGSFSGCRFPSDARYDVVLPDYPLDVGSGTAPLRVALPADTISVTLQARAVGGDTRPIGFYQVEQDGTLLFDLERIYRWEDVPNRWIPQDGYDVITLGVPNSTADRVLLRGRSLRVSVLVFPRTMGDTGRTTVRPSIRVRRQLDVGSGTLAVAVHLVGVGVSAADAPGNARVQALLTWFGELFAPIGIRLGAITYHDVSAPALQVIDSADGPDSELAQLFRLSAGRSGDVLSLFLVRAIETGGSGFNTLGIAGGIPGPIAVHGSMHSGVAVAFDASVVGAGTGGGRVAGHITAHESGHYLGLYHVTERLRACTGGETPETTMCMPFGGGDPISDTRYGDDTNLMHWSLVGMGSNTVLSAGQGFVLRRAGIVAWP